MVVTLFAALTTRDTITPLPLLLADDDGNDDDAVVDDDMRSLIEMNEQYVVSSLCLP